MACQKGWMTFRATGPWEATEEEDAEYGIRMRTCTVCVCVCVCAAVRQPVIHKHTPSPYSLSHLILCGFGGWGPIFPTGKRARPRAGSCSTSTTRHQTPLARGETYHKGVRRTAPPTRLRDTLRGPGLGMSMTPRARGDRRPLSPTNQSPNPSSSSSSSTMAPLLSIFTNEGPSI